VTVTPADSEVICAFACDVLAHNAFWLISTLSTTNVLIRAVSCHS
jgi:hypothetical protein